MFLKTLWEHKRPGGQFTGHAWSVGQLVRSTLPIFLKLPNLNNDVRQPYALTKEEQDVLLEGVEELQRDGFLKNDPNQSHEFKALTDKGLKVVHGVRFFDGKRGLETSRRPRSKRARGASPSIQGLPTDGFGTQTCTESLAAMISR
jgi:hypothetical protein